MIDYVIRVKIDSGFLTIRQGSFIPSVEMWTGKVTAGISTDEVVMVDDDQFIQHRLYFFPEPQGQGSFLPTELLIA